MKRRGMRRRDTPRWREGVAMVRREIGEVTARCGFVAAPSHARAQRMRHLLGVADGCVGPMQVLVPVDVKQVADLLLRCVGSATLGSARPMYRSPPRRHPPQCLLARREGRMHRASRPHRAWPAPPARPDYRSRDAPIPRRPGKAYRPARWGRTQSSCDRIQRSRGLCRDRAWGLFSLPDPMHGRATVSACGRGAGDKPIHMPSQDGDGGSGEARPRHEAALKQGSVRE